jgi:hypothetical protein
VRLSRGGGMVIVFGNIGKASSRHFPDTTYF